MRAGIHLTAGADHFLDGLEPTIVLLQRGGVLESSESGTTLPTAKGRRTVELMEAGRINFDKPNANFKWPGHSQRFEHRGHFEARLLDVRDLQDFAEQISPITIWRWSHRLLTSALGIDEARTYLILAQNNDESAQRGISVRGVDTCPQWTIQDQEYFPTTNRSPASVRVSGRII